ncbi:LysR family transcriptional regulator [Dyella ginsengisoli]|uniref:LysR family transcriptional regulator n=1 Tax=Dyella ginsengisoli TaxID=363848 RepID=UPI00036F5FD2|nr:LysR family transcriptional regulator [Dyella ginsengisoli]
MDRDVLTHLPVVAAVARRRSFAAAAAELGMSPSAVSHAVRLVEDRLKSPLFARTTRSVALTEAGEDFFARALPALQQLAEATEATRALKGVVSGTLRINAPRVALPMALTGLVATLATRHPDLVVDVTCDDALTDIVAQGYDAGVRLGEMVAEDMVAVRLTPPVRAIMVAAPGYLAAYGTPARVADLRAHNCINYRQASTGGTYAWELRERGKDVTVAVRGTARVSDSLFAIDLALAGVGIAYLFEPLVAGHLRAGRLVQVLPKAAMPEPGLFLYFPRRASEAPKLRVLIDAARERLG